jgi:hypothetical protein
VAAQPLVDQLDGDSQFFAHSIGKSRGFSGHLAGPAIKVQGPSNDNRSHVKRAA